MARGTELTIAGKRYANAAAYIQAIVGSLKTMADAEGASPVPVTIRPSEALDRDEIEALV